MLPLTLLIALMLPSPIHGKSSARRLPPGPIYGATFDRLDRIDDIVDSLARLKRRATARIVLDRDVEAASYRPPLEKIGGVAYVMGELLDSFEMQDISVADFAARTIEYVDELSHYVDLWEIGNEVNGEWVGGDAATARKIGDAFRIVRERGSATALTLYYNVTCFQDPTHEMFTWAERWVPDEVKRGLDYVLVSYYEDDCGGPPPDWNAVFQRLGVLFPEARVGFGEVGTHHVPQKLAFIRRYYSMQVTAPRYVGGYFWWYGWQDFVPHTTEYWKAFATMLER